MKFLLLFAVILLSSSCSRFKTHEEMTSKAELAEPMVEEGVAYFLNGQDSLAINRWNAALRLIPADAEVYNFKGMAEHRSNKVDSALWSFRKATALNPNYFEAENNLGYMLFLKENYSQALLHFNRSLFVNPSYQPALKNKQLTESVLQGNLDKKAFDLSEKAAMETTHSSQISLYKKVISLDSTFSKAYNNMAAAYYFSGQTDSAMFYLEKAIRVNPDYPEALNNYAYILMDHENYEKAIPVFLKAISLKPRYFAALNNLGEAYFLYKEKENARKVFNTVLSLKPDDVRARDWLLILDETE